MIRGSVIAAGTYVAWERLSDVGAWVVVLFGMLLWVICLFSLFRLGMRVMSAGRDRRTKHERGRPAKKCI
jgi:hypothetical protein